MALMPTISCRSLSCSVLIPIRSIPSSRKLICPHTFSAICVSKKCFDKLNSKCSLTDTSMVDDIVAVIKKRENSSSGTPNCPVHIILPSEKDNVVDAPVYPTALFLLYANCLAGNIVEQLWNFTWPAAIAMIHPTMLPVAIIGFVTKITVIFGGPLVGKLMDFFPRVPAYNSLSFVQVVAQLCSVAMIIHAHTATSATLSSTFFHPWFIALVFASAVERLSGLALGVSMERDWVVLLAGLDRPVALAEANAVLNRIDLLCEIAGSFLFGILLSKYDPVTCLKFASHLMIWSLPVVASLTWLTNKLSHGILGRPRSVQTSEAYNKDINAGVRSVKDGWLEYIRQPVLPASIAYVILYFNIALTPGGLMTTFLTQRGLNPLFIGTFGGLCASMGIAATFISADLVRKLGILKAGAAGLVFQASLLTVACAVYCSGSVSRNIPLFFFLSSIVLSRLGHMSYDVVGTQILQTGIPPSKANLIGITEVSVSSFAELLMLGVAIFAKSDSHFGLLIFLSLLSVIASAFLFCWWLTSPTDEQRNLFFFDPLF